LSFVAGKAIGVGFLAPMGAYTSGFTAGLTSGLEG